MSQARFPLFPQFFPPYRFRHSSFGLCNSLTRVPVAGKEAFSLAEENRRLQKELAFAREEQDLIDGATAECGCCQKKRGHPDERSVDTPRHKDLIYDIGMHKGEDAEFYLRKGFRVVAFEADPDLVRSCRKRLGEFVDRRRLTIIEGAILESDAIDAGQRKVQFYKNVDVPALGTVCADWAERNTRLGTSSITVEVDAVDLAGVMQEHGIPHFMKIDIEGCDMACVRLLRRFRERPDFISVESDKTSFANIESEIDALVDLGYDCFQAVEQSGIPQSQSPPYPSREGEYVAQRFEFGSSGLFGSELGDRWKTKREILRQYRAVWLGYQLLGDDGMMTQWKFQGARTLRSLTSRFLRILTKARVPGWYDTHARRSVADEME